MVFDRALVKIWKGVFVLKIVQVSVQELPEEQKSFLLDLMMRGEKKSAVPVYYRNEVGEVFFVADCVLRDVKAFEKAAPKGLYRGGALLKLLTKYGQVVLYDERYRWLRLIGGIARFDEGDNLTKTAIREAVVEELAVLAENETVRLVPEGSKNLVGLSIPGWGITVQDILEAGSLSVVDYFFNDANRAFEVVVEWNLIDWNELSILHSEDWFKGGRSGFTPFVINECADIVGVFDGRHGYVSLPVVHLHPTLESCL
ncbi:MAG: hypothetical protein KIH89_003630 [Candidatus Shapirobacteria bacterium]|nr:hypothetical protein [Candidatus Shapirobacteria bacterium]